MKRLVAASVFAAAFGAFATDYAWKGGSSTDWTLPENYEPEAVPGSGDSVKVPENTTLRLVSTDAASWAVANRLSYVKPQTATSYFEVEVPSGEASLECGVSYDASTWLSAGKGGLVKKGSGALHLMKGGDEKYSYYTSITVEEGVLHAPTNITSWSLFLHDKVHVADGAAFAVAYGASGRPNNTIRGLTGGGTITNTSGRANGEYLIIDAGTADFSGDIGGSVTFLSGADVTLRSDSSTMTGLYFCVYNNQGAGASGAKTAFTKLGMAGGASSLGAAPLQFSGGRDGTADAAGYLLYLGSGETSDKSISFGGTTVHPSYLDAGANGGLILTGTIGLMSDAAQNYSFVLTGSNTAECVVAGDISDGSGHAITNIVKQGGGSWRFSDVARGWSGGLTVEDGVLRYDSLAPLGTACALGSGSGAGDYPILLKGGTFEYSGDSALDAKGRTIGVSGTATLRNASGKKFGLDGVAAVTEGSTLVLDGDDCTTNTLSGVSGALSLRKTGGGVWKLYGEQSFSGDIAVDEGTLLVARTKYEYFRLWFRDTVADKEGFYVGEVGLYSSDGARQNAGMVFVDETVNAADLEPGTACIGIARTIGLAKSGNDQSKMFDDTDTPFFAYQRPGAGQPVIVLDSGDEASWLPVVMRLSGEARPVTSYNVVVGGKSAYNANGSVCSVDSYRLQGSVDGVNWVNLSETNGYVQIGAAFQWFAGGTKYESGGAATHTTGIPVASGPESVVLDNVGCVSVASGATLRALSDDIEISKVVVPATGAGMIDNFRIAAGGTIDVSGVSPGVSLLMLTFANATAEDVANLEGWTLTADGAASENWTKKVYADGTVRLARKCGLTVIFR